MYPCEILQNLLKSIAQNESLYSLQIVFIIETPVVEWHVCTSGIKNSKFFHSTRKKHQQNYDPCVFALIAQFG